MRPRRVPTSNVCFRRKGFSEDHDLWAEEDVDVDGLPILRIVWDFDEVEREMLAVGGTVEVMFTSRTIPAPFGLGVGPPIEYRKANPTYNAHRGFKAGS